MKKRLLFIFVLSIVLARSVSAQIYSLADCIKVGLERNYSLRLVKTDEQIAASNATRANAGYLPSVSASAGYSGSQYGRKTTSTDGASTKIGSTVDHTLRAGVDAEWTIFDGFKIQTTYARLQELRAQSATQTRMAIEDFMADLSAEYYNYVQQRVRMGNLRYAVALSKERLRIAEERYIIGRDSRLSLLQAQVDFNADRADALKQEETLATSLIRLKELMGLADTTKVGVSDTTIIIDFCLSEEILWNSTLKNNTALLNAAHNKALAEIDRKAVRSRDFPYLKLNAGYGYTYNNYGIGTTQKRGQWGADFGLTMGFKIFDGNRRRERRNAEYQLERTQLQEDELHLTLRADLADFWQAYQNNLRLLHLEEENLVAARENYAIAHERFMLGDLPGIEIREAQKSLLNAEERILSVTYATKLCEISLLQLSGAITGMVEK